MNIVKLTISVNVQSENSCCWKVEKESIPLIEMENGNFKCINDIFTTRDLETLRNNQMHYKIKDNFFSAVLVDPTIEELDNYVLMGKSKIIETKILRISSIESELKMLENTLDGLKQISPELFN